MAIIILKNRKSLYQVRVKDLRGYLLPQKSFAKEADARRYERKLYERRDSNGGADSRKVKLTFASYWEMWAIAGLSTTSGWSHYQLSMWEKYVQPRIGKKALGEITGNDIDLVLKDLENLGRSDQTRLHVYNLLHKMFVDAPKKHGINFLNGNPVKDAKKPSVGEIDVPFLDPQEAKRYVLKVCGTYLEVPVAVQLFAFLRVSEVQALTWDNIDWERAELKVFKRYRRKLKAIGDCSKLKPGGRIPISPPLMDILKRAYANHVSRFVAPGKNGGMLNYNSYYRAVKSACDGLDLKQVIGTQGLRHSASEVYVENAGATEEDIARMLRHKSSKCTRRYMHQSNERQKMVVSRLNVADWVPQTSGASGVQGGVQEPGN